MKKGFVTSLIHPRGLEKDTSWLSMLTVVCILFILWFGLRPKYWPEENKVRWLPNLHAIHFEPPAIAFVDRFTFGSDSEFTGEFTLHLAVTASTLQKKGFRPLLMLHDGNDSSQLAIWHWGGSVIIMNGDDYDFSRRLPRISVPDVLHVGKISFLTLSSGSSGTQFYIDGQQARETDGWRLQIPEAKENLRLILGNSVYGRHSWYGEFHGLALYGRSLSANEVEKQYLKWRQTSSLEGLDSSQLKLLYNFTKGKGREVTDMSGTGNSLLIPERPVILKKTFLSMPHKEIHSQSYWLDAFFNVVGFIPLGALVFACFRYITGLRVRSAAGVSLGLCFGLSLFMELLQGWLPGRDSSMQDLVLNSLGGFMGILLASFLVQLFRFRQPS
ncbi:VanZ family protein [Desulfopila sp. IMCC35008]|uniref:VanZ family protein n=1 Tax=Desulfopila sp. IMCC35008 TaxID=2653858 RepID=UPI0013D152C5|nr:VanZ family protein [Desulfopila sp. IMCC35008]